MCSVALMTAELICVHQLETDSSGDVYWTLLSSAASLKWGQHR